MNILFLTDTFPNYVPDLLLHGLRKLFGPSVVDFPRKDSLYKGELFGVSPDDQLCPNLFPTDSDVDRNDIARKVRTGFFRYIICDARLVSGVKEIIDEHYHRFMFTGVRSIPLFQDESVSLPPGLVFIDGEDYPFHIPVGPYVVCQRETNGSDYSIPLPMALPLEILKWIQSFNDAPKSFSVGFLGGDRRFFHGGSRQEMLEVLANRFPDSLLKISKVPSSGDPNPEGRLNRGDYYAAMQKCRAVLSLRGEGYDTFRFWENTAVNAVHIAQKMPLYIPYDFEHGKNILRFSNYDEMLAVIDAVLEEKINVEQIRMQSLTHLMRCHTTERRALYLLDRLGKTFE